MGTKRGAGGDYALLAESNLVAHVNHVKRTGQKRSQLQSFMNWMVGSVWNSAHIVASLKLLNGGITWQCKYVMHMTST